MTTTAITSESIEMYLKSICELEAIDSPVAISQLAQRQGVSPPSTIEMVKRLAAQELVTHTPYKGVSLTEKGRKRAHTILRRHRLWERFLADTLGLPWEQVHDHACRLEHATAPDVTDTLAEFLGHPKTCPHGNPIPGPDGNLTAAQTVPLSELEIGQRARLAHIAFEEAILLEYLARQNLYPDTTLVLEEVAPYQGPFIVRLEDREETQAIGREIAARLFVEMLPG
ncbi:MAG: metal-dependent transcriptional regulator [Anaerolineae bacterium]